MSCDRARPTTACGLDIGSNTFSFTELVQTVSGFDMVHDLSLPVRLSEGLVVGGLLKSAAVVRGLEAIAQLVRDCHLQDKPVAAVATEALRRTSRPDVFLDPARKILGCDIEVISAEKEARLTSRGAVMGLALQTPFAVVDVGGQSTEVSWEDRTGRWRASCFGFGVVDLTRRYLLHDPPTPDEMAALSTEVRRSVSSVLPPGLPGDLIGVAGTATTLGMLSIGMTSWERARVHGYKITLAELLFWKERLLSMSARERTERLGVRPVRADLIPAGVAVLEEIMTHCHCPHFIVSANGLRVGAALTLFDGPTRVS